MISMMIIVTIMISINLKKDEWLNLVNVVHAIANHSREAGFPKTFSKILRFLCISSMQSPSPKYCQNTASLTICLVSLAWQSSYTYPRSVLTSNLTSQRGQIRSGSDYSLILSHWRLADLIDVTLLCKDTCWTDVHCTCKHLKDWLGLSLRVRPLHTSTRFHQKSIKAYNTYGSAVHLGPTAKGHKDPSDINCRLIMMAIALIPNFLELAWGECPWVISTLVPEPMDQLDHDKDITGQYDPEMLQSKTKEWQSWGWGNCINLPLFSSCGFISSVSNPEMLFHQRLG